MRRAWLIGEEGKHAWGLPLRHVAVRGFFEPRIFVSMSAPAFVRFSPLGFVAFIVASVWPGALVAQPTRFKDVKAWRGTFVATAHTNDSIFPPPVAGLKFSYEASLSVSFVLDEFEDEPEVWSGRITSSNFNSSHDASFKNSDVEMVSDFSTGGPLIPERAGVPKLLFHRERGWSFVMGSPWRAIEAHKITRMLKAGMVFPEQQSSFAIAPNGTNNAPYPERGLVLYATGQTEAGLDSSTSSLPLINPPVSWTYTINLEPLSLQELRLEIEETPAYREWRPSAALDGGAGAPLEITARLVTADGKPPQSRIEQFEWKLEATSREPGIALNFPVDARGDRLDLELDAAGEMFELSQEKQRMVRVVREGFSDTVKVVPYDWGGWSTLRVTAIMADGRRVEGKLKGKDEAGARLPKRAFDSHIADVWKSKAGVAGPDNADDENAPVGDGAKGDGLTLYEEYRGFYEAGSHIEGDPKKKDFFVDLNDAWIALPGVVKFRQLTGLKVHFLFTRAEFPESRVMNANHDRGAHLVAQHGVRMRINKALHGKADTVGGPGNPKMITSIDLMSDFARFDPARAAKIAAHELCHAVNVSHHGDTDEKVGWIALEGKLYEVSSAAPRGAEITVLTEQQEDITLGIIAELSALPENATVGYLGRDNGQHSGAECCVMRYHNAKTYALRAGGGPPVRYSEYVEPIGATCLCTTTAGSGVNEEGRQPQSRYGPTLAGRGNCLHQIHVTDAIAAPSHGGSSASK